MPDEKKLVPNFMPPLALMLANAERTKGGPLTEAEALKLRDKSPCIMMEATDIRTLDASRGYRDVNPENIWADWHRLRAQITGNGCLPKIVLCIPGDADFRAACGPFLEAEGVEHEFRPRDDGMQRAFQVASMTRPSLTEDDLAHIGRHGTVLYVLSKNVTAAEAPAASKEFLRLGRRLLDAGGIAVKCESAGIAHSKARWTELAELSEKKEALWTALFRAMVVVLIGSKADFYSCGMHLLGKPDLIIAKSSIAARPGESAVTTAATLFRVFAMYLLEECPNGEFTSGHIFSIGRDEPRYRLTWEPCAGFAEDSFFFNPFGLLRFAPA
jgi:hypothetical protein